MAPATPPTTAPSLAPVVSVLQFAVFADDLAGTSALSVADEIQRNAAAALGISPARVRVEVVVEAAETQPLVMATY